MADGQVVFEISGDNRNVKQALSDTTSAIESESKKWDKAAGDSARTMEDKLTAAFKAITASAVAMKASKALLDFGKEAVQAASDLQEVQNVVDVTFGDNANQIEKWAKNAGQQFGLTETQAKRFTSTLGAMMKSAGLAGPEIVDMSTDLAGLAADMASFYNLDFDTAFQKIRSGISGETEPLKQLGINMSVANLEAFALTQGISKAFDKMTQGEQTLLRYQYLMQATADAQGDFARTSDGYANAVRALQTNIDNLKTSIGSVILPIISEVVQGINDMIGAMTQTKPKTVLDEFAEIDLKTAEKLAEIQETADEANALIGVLEEIGGKEITATSLTSFIDSLSGSISGLDTAMEKAKTGDYAGTIEELARVLSTQIGGSADQWKTLLTAIGDSLPGAVDATLSDSGQTAAFLEAAGAAADSLGGEYPGLWEQMLKALGDNAGAAINALANGATAGAALEAMANGVNSLGKDVDVTKWKTLLTALSETGAINLGNSGKSLEDLAAALNGSDPNTDRAEAWKELLGALSADVEGLSKLTGMSAEETATWLSTLAEGANALDPNSAEGWSELFGSLVEGLPGLENTGYADVFKELAKGADDSEAYLKALGYSSEEIAAKQEEWLDTCRRLVDTLPGLSSIINTQTGEVEGGVQAIEDYVAAWVNGEKYITLMQAQEEKRRALNAKYGELPGLEVDWMVAENRVKEQKAKLDALREKYGFDGEGYDLIVKLNATGGQGNLTEQEQEWNTAITKLGELKKASADAEAEYNRQAEGYKEGLALIEEGDKAIEATKDAAMELAGANGEVANSAEEAAKAIREYSDEEKKAAKEAVTAATKALEEVDKAYKKIYDGVRGGLDKAADGFSEVETPAEKARKKMADLTKEIDKLNKAGKDSSGVSKTFQQVADSIPSIQNMTMGLQSQLDYLEKYQRDYEAARARGVSESILAAMSDGSVESADYLHALATGSDEEIAKLNEMWQSIITTKEEMTTNMADTKAAADEDFQELVNKAEETVANLDKYSAAESALESTTKGIADGIAAGIPAIQTQVEALNAVLSNLGKIGGTTGAFLGTTFHLDGSHAMGLDYVPFNNYLAQLHEGESILTAEEARVWRAFKNGGASVANSIDYDAMGGLMRENIKPGGNVYLDGRIVGQVVSERQGNSLRALERSGWQG